MKHIKYPLYGLLFIFLLSSLILSRDKNIGGDRVLDFTYGDINGDNKKELLVLTKRAFAKYGRDLVIYPNQEDLREIYREDLSELRPWKITCGDMDGDGIEEISIGVYKKARFHQVMDKRPFIYNYKNDRLQPRWRGSRLSKPIVDYIFYDLDKDGSDEIVSIEKLQDGSYILSSYKWKGFGFEAYLLGGTYKELKSLYIEDGIIYNKKKGKKMKILVSDKILKIEGKD